MRVLLSLFTLALTLLLPISVTSAIQPHSLEQEAAIDWILLDNAKRSKPLSEKTVFTIVHTAYYYAQERKLDPHQLLAIMRQESSFNPKAHSFVNAQGLMQVMPRWHYDKLHGRSAYDPVVNIEVGSQIYQDCLKKHKGNAKKAAVCYSGGANKYYAKVEKHKQNLLHHIDGYAQVFPPNEIVVAGR